MCEFILCKGLIGIALCASYSSDMYINHYDTGIVNLILHKRVELLLLQYLGGLS